MASNIGNASETPAPRSNCRRLKIRVPVEKCGRGVFMSLRLFHPEELALHHPMYQ